jgi:hypothetical protein
MSIQLILSIWGAGLSTILATVHLLSLYRNRTRLSSSYHFGANEGTTDDIIVYNIRKRDLLVNDYLLFFAKSKSSEKKYIEKTFPDESVHLSLKANDRIKLSFADQDRISFSHNRKKTLFLELNIVGRKSRKVLRIA